MERVAKLLDPQDEAFSYRRALVCLWAIASDDQVLNQWEQLANEQTIDPQVQDLLNKLQDEQAIDAEAIHSHPLALIRALDDYLASVRLPSSQSTSFAETTYLHEEDKKSYWLVPVTLAARRLATMNRQPARLARWFHHHAVLPHQTASNIDVSCTWARSGLDTCLANLASQEQATLKVWIAHFDDGADVVWDTTASPIGNWRAQHVHPHAQRQASATQTLNEAATANAQIVVFPEFTLDLQHRAALTHHLRQNPSSIQLVVAGAFHATPTQPPEEGIYNTAPVFNANGNTLFEHRKLRLFGRDDVGAEFAEVGNRLHVLVTPIGCMTVLICKDFLDEDPRVNNLLTEVPVDWAWVPSYGDETTLRAHQARAKKLATVTTGTSCAVAQTQNTAMKKEGEDLGLLPGFGHAAGQKIPSVVQKSGGVVEFSLASQAVPTKPSGSPLKRIK